MKNKGFTLVELLGVIVLLGLLGVVIIPKVGDSITNSKNQAYSVQVENIKKGVKDFLIDNTYVMTDNETITLKLGVLKQGGYLPINIKNPITKKNFSNESLITIKNNNNNYDIELALQDLEDVSETVDSNSPILVLNGNYIEYVNVKEPYIEKGATARTSSGEIIDNISIQIKLNDEEKSKVETDKLDTYNVIYSATDQGGYTTSATRTVIIRDNETPKITLPKDTILYVSEVAGYDLMKDATITDNYDKNPTIQVDSSLSNIVGKYVITYTATDSSGNQTIERRVINVTDQFEKSSTYTRLDYIKTNGNQYIDLNYMAKTTTEIRLDIELIENDLTNSAFDAGGTNLIGRNQSSTQYFTVNFGAATTQSKTIYYWVDVNNNVQDYKKDYEQVTNRSTMIVKSGTATFQGITHAIETKTANNDASMLLLANYSVAAGEKIIPFKRYDAKIYGFQIYEGNTLVKNLVPCYRNSDNVAGLYDLVNNAFYTSDGDNDFFY